MAANAACHGRHVFRRPLHTHVLQTYINNGARRCGQFRPTFLKDLAGRVFLRSGGRACSMFSVFIYDCFEQKDVLSL